MKEYDFIMIGIAMGMSIITICLSFLRIIEGKRFSIHAFQFATIIATITVILITLIFT